MEKFLEKFGIEGRCESMAEHYAAAVGYFSLRLLVMTLKGKWFWLFGPYCILAGLVTLLFG